MGRHVFLYEKALKVKYTVEHIERINDEVNYLMRLKNFKKVYLKTVRLMRENGISLQKFVNPLTKKTRYKPTCYRFIGVYMWLMI